MCCNDIRDLLNVYVTGGLNIYNCQELLSSLINQEIDMNTPVTIEIQQNEQTGAIEVFIDGNFLSPVHSQSVLNHSPDGFNVGYSGSGPAQLALAILLRFCRATTTAVQYHQQFKADFVSTWQPGNDYMIDILGWLQYQRRD